MFRWAILLCIMMLWGVQLSGCSTEDRVPPPWRFEHETNTPPPAGLQEDPGQPQPERPATP